MCQAAALAVLIYSLLVKAAKHSWAYRRPSEGECGVPVTGSQHWALQTCHSSLSLTGIELAFLCLSTKISFEKESAVQNPCNCLAR